MKSLMLALGMLMCAANAMAATWTGVANCRATPPFADEEKALPLHTGFLVGTVLSSLGTGGAMALAYPGTGNENYEASYAYACVITGNFTVSGAPHEGDWVLISLNSTSKYSDYVLHNASVALYTDPAGAGGYGGGPPNPIGYNAPWEFCTSNNVPFPALQQLSKRSCLLQAFEQAESGRCLTYPTEPNHPTWFIFDGLYNSSGQYCPANYGGQIDATVCADGSVWNGIVSCEGR